VTFPTEPNAPTWVDFSPDPVSGLDLLGLRLPTRNIGLSLLNGITTISPKVRYLSFRTFIADAYRTAPGPPPDSHDSFLSFALPAEAAYVFGNALVDPDASNIVGITRAKELLDENSTNVPLNKLVGQPAVNVYAGPAQELGLVGIRPKGSPSVDVERGLPLAEVLRKEWGHTTIGDHILSGERLRTATIEELREFGQSCKIGLMFEDERALLIDAILPPAPHPTEVERLRTYALLLHLAAELQNHKANHMVRERDLRQAAQRAAYDAPEVLRPALDGWLLYQVRDCLAMAHEAALEQVVLRLGSERAGPGGISETSVLDFLLSDQTPFERLWSDLGLAGEMASLSELRLSDLREMVKKTCSTDLEVKNGLRRWNGDFSEWKLIEYRKEYGAGALLLLPLSWLLAEWRTKPGVEEKLPSFDGLSLGGVTRIGLRQVVLPRLKALMNSDARLDAVIAELTVLTVRQHTQIALSRLAQDPSRDVTVLRIEGSNWIKLHDYTPGLAASRIPQAINWLHQLGLISETGITDEGEVILKRALSTLETLIIE